MSLADRLAQPDVAGLTDWQAAAVLSAPDEALPPKRVPVRVVDVVNHLRRAGKWLGIKAAAAGGNIGAAAAVDIAEDLRTETIDMDAEIVGTMLALMVPDVLTQAEADALVALANAPQSWAEANGYPNGVTARDVGLARGAG